jgi:transcriptional regulator with PAS, ATPase and Fis domain
MESGVITLDQKALDEFLSDVPTSRTYNNREFTAFEDAAIMAAWERGLNKEAVAKKLGISYTTLRRRYYELTGKQ